MTVYKNNEYIFSVDFSENSIRKKYPQLLELLLKDRTTNKNIIWASNDYLSHGRKEFSPKSEIKAELITGVYRNLIMPRALKEKVLKRSRTTEIGEVFTPLWIVKLQNDSVDNEFEVSSFENYIKRTYLEITCGEAPYLTTRYEMLTGEFIEVDYREGILDRKLKLINSKIHNHEEWLEYIYISYKAIYGFEWNGDSLLIARENLLGTFIDFYFAKWKKSPSIDLLKKIAFIISYNIFQADGNTKTIGHPSKNRGNYLIIPLSEIKTKIKPKQLSIFEIINEEYEKEEQGSFVGKRVKIMNWECEKMEYFDLEVQ